MNSQSLAAVVAEKFGDKWVVDSKFSNPNNPKMFRIKSLTLESLRDSYIKLDIQLGVSKLPKDLDLITSIMVEVRFDNSDKLVYVSIPHRCASILFNDPNMTAQEFCKTFIESYKIPEMNYDVGMNGVGFWKYTSPDNVMVIVTSAKDVFLKRVDSNADIQKSFN